MKALQGGGGERAGGSVGLDDALANSEIIHAAKAGLHKLAPRCDAVLLLELVVYSANAGSLTGDGS
jgi:hypothetical protein